MFAFDKLVYTWKHAYQFSFQFDSKGSVEATAGGDASMQADRPRRNLRRRWLIPNKEVRRWKWEKKKMSRFFWRFHSTRRAQEADLVSENKKNYLNGYANLCFYSLCTRTWNTKETSGSALIKWNAKMKCAAASGRSSIGGGSHSDVLCGLIYRQNKTSEIKLPNRGHFFSQTDLVASGVPRKTGHVILILYKAKPIAGNG